MTTLTREQTNIIIRNEVKIDTLLRDIEKIEKELRISRKIIFSIEPTYYNPNLQERYGLLED